jgi:hypothetical protein
MRKRYSDEDLEDIYGSWKRSGMGQKAYSEKKGIDMNVFKTELYELRKRRKKECKREVGFHRIKVSDMPPKIEEVPYCEMTFSGKHRVTFKDKGSVIALKRLMMECLQV